MDRRADDAVGIASDNQHRHLERGIAARLLFDLRQQPVEIDGIGAEIGGAKHKPRTDALGIASRTASGAKTLAIAASVVSSPTGGAMA